MLPVSALCTAFAGPPPARMHATLPGVKDPSPYTIYSGYLDAGVPPSGRGKMYLHYICTMAPDWVHMPLTIWYNGGPGAPSTYGLFQEFGPFLLTEESYLTPEYKATGVPTPVYNPWTWANASSLCEIDSPAPMGASYCTEGNGTAGSEGGPGGDAYSCGAWTDQRTAAANHQAHIALFNDAFPEFEASQQPVSIAGESYAGVYVPLFIDRWLDDPVRGPSGKLINLLGFAVGDGFPACIPIAGRRIDWCVDLNHVGFFEYPNALPGPRWDLEFFHGHSQLSEALHARMLATCSADELDGKHAPAPLGAACAALVEEMRTEVGFFYAYNLFEACPDEVPATSRRMLGGAASRRLRRRTPPPPLAPSAGDGDTGLGAPCLGRAMEDYFALNATKLGLGIPLENRFIALDNGIGFSYTTDASFVGHAYAKAIKQGKRVLVYEGDSDDCGLQTAPIEAIWVPFLGNGTGTPDGWTPVGPLAQPSGEGGEGGHGSAAVTPLGLPMSQPWRPFGVEPAGRKVQGGFSMAWNGGQVTFASIRGAGHLAPLYRPAASYTLMHAYHTQQPLPPAFSPPTR